ncbi:putative gluconate TRAP family transporter, DctP subunit [Marinobacterium lacunae]|uniref:Putative gluconate TRAP family transporter, DctP subunit n=1 Tax=Marinobacterium lacunae TaxID=1232683 RepID=A0A081G4I0_9GAMM|nr:TRAP transporter substrate-binding protein [Marinobacterium lacunae]KEA65685.1 putative gluconate TRAP family transporter, DctP subunit [Marinobacterium lacunae]
MTVRRFLNTSLALTTACALTLSATAEARTLKVQTSFNASHISLNLLNEKWVPKLKEMTNGSIDLMLLPVKSVVPHRDTPEAVAMGILDGDLTATSYFSGIDPAFALMGDLTAGYTDPAQIQEFCMQGGGKEMLQKLFDKYQPGIHVIGCSSEKSEAFVSKVPINGVGDLTGLKIRTPEGLAADVFKRAGASPVSLPGSEVYTALEKNVIDAADSSAYANNDASGMHKVAKYPLYPGIHSIPFMQFTISDLTWNKLSDSEKTALNQWFTAAYDDLRQYMDAKDKELVARDRAAGKLTIIDWPQAERDKFRKIAQQSWEAFANASPLAKEVYEAHIRFMSSKGML